MTDSGTANLSPGTVPFVVWVDDNFHHGDEDERYREGEHASYDEALAVCRQIVEADLQHHHKSGMSFQELYACYTGFGSDPWIAGKPPEDQARFSAWQYAEKRAKEICGNNG